MLTFLHPFTWSSPKLQYNNPEATTDANKRRRQRKTRRGPVLFLLSAFLVAETTATPSLVHGGLVRRHVGTHSATLFRRDLSTTTRNFKKLPKSHPAESSAQDSTEQLYVQSTVSVDAIPTTQVSLTPSASASSTLSPNATAYPIINPQIADPTWSFPEPFDTTLSTNFTSLSCPSYFNTFINSPFSQACKPLSMLINTSNAFFIAQRNATTILPYVLSEICTAPASCNGTMAAFANRMQQADACQADLAAGNALAVSALNGLKNYAIMAEVGCYTNPVTNNNCFVDAVAGGDPSSLYWFYLASGTPLPSGTKSDCGECQQRIMNTYSRFATNASLPISQTYPSARTLSIGQCGVDFAPLVAAVSPATAISPNLKVYVVVFTIFYSLFGVL